MGVPFKIILVAYEKGRVGFKPFWASEEFRSRAVQGRLAKLLSKPFENPSSTPCETPLYEPRLPKPKTQKTPKPKSLKGSKILDEPRFYREPVQAQNPETGSGSSSRSSSKRAAA